MIKGKSSSLILRDFGKEYPIISHGEGIYLYDEGGKKYIDGSSGSAAVSNIGHGVREVVSVIGTEAKRLAYCPGHYFTNRPAVELADLLVEVAPEGLNNVWLVSDGSEATENAVKLARQYHLEKGNAAKSVVICRWQSYHGGTLGALGFGGLTLRRKKYLPLFVDSPHIPAAYCYRCYFGKEYPSCGILCAWSLEKTIREVGPENVAAFIAEPVVGAALGAVPPVDQYFPIIRDICNRYDVLLIADEVMTGFGRTGEMFGIDHWKIKPDLMACAKGISGGYVPLGAVIADGRIIDLMEKNKSNIVSGHTYSAHHLIAAVGVEVIKYILKHDLVKKAKENGQYFLQRLKQLSIHPIVGDIRGKGLFAGIELVKNKPTQEPFAPGGQVAAKIGAEALKRGLITYPGSGSVDGVMGDHILMAPPLVIERSEIDQIVSILDESIEQVQREVS
jgi:adenosylmethionine-8-amino-7-oxononanoate aminotransferase